MYVKEKGKKIGKSWEKKSAKMRALRLSHSTRTSPFQSGKGDRTHTGQPSHHLSILLDTSGKHQGGPHIPLWKCVPGEDPGKTSVSPAGTLHTVQMARGKRRGGKGRGHSQAAQPGHRSGIGVHLEGKTRGVGSSMHTLLVSTVQAPRLQGR